MTDAKAQHDEIVAYLYGELEKAEVDAFEKRMAEDPELNAEVEGLRATQTFIGADLKSGMESGQDLPPAHLVDAIMRAEAIERSPAIREAVIARSTHEEPWHKRFFLALLGGGALATTAVVVIFVSVTAGQDKEMAPPAADMAALQAPAEKPAAEPSAPSAGSVPGGMAESEEKKDQGEGAELAKSESASAGAMDMKAADNVLRRAESKKADGFGSLGGKGASSNMAQAAPADALADDEGGQMDGDFAAKEALAEEAPAADKKDPAKKSKAKRRSAAKKSAPPPPAPKTSAPESDSAGSGRGADLSSPMGRIEAGDKAFSRRKYTEAQSHYTNAIRLDPRGKKIGLRGYVGLMKVYEKTGRPRSALNQQKRMEAASINTPGAADGIWVAARIRRKMGEVDEARRLYEKLLSSPAYKTRAQRKLDQLSRK
jgi:tetratricopeptide (TPR) repeat protein